MNANAPSKGVIRRLPIWLRLVFVALVLLLVVGLAAPYFLDLDHYRTLIATTVEKQTGRVVTLGKIRAKFLPSVGFEADDVHLGNPPGFPQGDFLSVEKVSGSLAWGPLFHKQIQINSIEMVKPKVTVLTDARGRTNYDFSAPGSEGRPAKRGEKSADSSGGGSSFSLEGIGKIVLSGAAISMAQVKSRGQMEPTGRMGGLNLELSNVSLDPAALKRTAGEADLSGLTVEMAGLGAPIEFKSGKVKLQDGAAQGQFQAQLGKAAEVKGTLKIADLMKPVTEFELSTGQLNVNALLAETSGSDKKASAEDRSVQSTATEAGGPSELVAKGKVTAERISFAPYTANNGLVELRVFTDRVEAWPVQMQAYGGVLQLTARGDRTKSPLRFSANVKVSNFDIGKFVSVDPATKGKITGNADLNLQLVGSAVSRLLETLTGAGDFAVHDGTLPGLNLQGALGSIAKFLGHGGAPTTPFRLIRGDLTVAQGRVASKQIHMDSSEGTVDLQGSFGFDQTIEYNGQAVLTGGAASPVGLATDILGAALGKNIKSATIPFAVHGTFSSPKVAPGRGLPKFQTAQPNGNPSQPNQPQKPSLQDTLRDLFKKPPPK
ncbi:MAG TPA: AsmA family protein [Candidatus Acidoferrales bacterium]|nr:AsmA family protein [Candidatus Acidoferrales bacterium]